jgi:hypothetical protein
MNNLAPCRTGVGLVRVFIENKNNIPFYLPPPGQSPNQGAAH